MVAETVLKEDCRETHRQVSVSLKSLFEKVEAIQKDVAFIRGKSSSNIFWASMIGSGVVAVLATIIITAIQLKGG